MPMVIIHPIVDFILGGVCAVIVFFQATDSWWKAPIMLRWLLRR
jgi:hypothetical protein